MLTIGLAGGIGSGKSTVAELLAERGAVLLDADKFAHEALGAPEVVRQIVERWGDGLLGPEGALDRSALAERVFAAGEAAAADRRFLEGLVHPRVRERMLGQIEAYERSGGRVAVLDVPLLLEAGWDRDCDLLVMVDAPRAARLARVASRGWDADELAQREATQLPMSEKRARADVVIANDGDLRRLRRAVERVWREHVAPRLD